MAVAKVFLEMGRSGAKLNMISSFGPLNDFLLFLAQPLVPYCNIHM